MRSSVLHIEDLGVNPVNERIIYCMKRLRVGCHPDTIKVSYEAVAFPSHKSATGSTPREAVANLERLLFNEALERLETRREY